MDPSNIVKASDRTNVTLLCEVTSGNPSTLTRVILGPEEFYSEYDELFIAGPLVHRGRTAQGDPRRELHVAIAQRGEQR